MEYQVDVTVDRNGDSRSFQRVQQNEVEIRDPSQSYQMLLERSMQQGLNGNRRYSRPAEFFEGFWFQTPPLSLTQNLTAYQFLGSYDIILPRPESFEVCNFRANLR